jgi:hypothetical protein
VHCRGWGRASAYYFRRASTIGESDDVVMMKEQLPPVQVSRLHLDHLQA